MTEARGALVERLEAVGIQGPVLSAVELAGGVSGEVTAVTTPDGFWVVKSARPRLEVPEPWFAPVSRSRIEYLALLHLNACSPGAVPPVVGWHKDTVVTGYIGGGETWKSALLAGRVEGDVALVLADLLTAWQRLDVTAWFVDVNTTENLRALRTDPFHRDLAARLPELRLRLLELADAAESCRDGLVHGDFSPKNFLVGTACAPHVTVLDWEVAHMGDHAFDPAFVVAHLLLKQCARKDSSIAEVADMFLAKFAAQRGDVAWSRLWGHAATVMLTRVIGRSRVDYLDSAAQNRVLRSATALLREPPDTQIPAARILL